MEYVVLMYIFAIVCELFMCTMTSCSSVLC